MNVCVALVLQVAAANLALELPDPQSPWRAYWDALPTAEELLCPLVSLPTAYLPLLNSQPLVSSLAQAGSPTLHP